MAEGLGGHAEEEGQRAVPGAHETLSDACHFIMLHLRPAVSLLATLPPPSEVPLLSTASS